MSTTSLKLPEDLKQKAAAAARELGITPHAFMVEAIRQAAAASEQRAQFVAEAVKAREQMLETGLGHDPAEVRAYLRERIEKQDIPRPPLKPWRG